MGLKPSEIRLVSIYDFNLMARAYEEKLLHDYTVMRLNSYLISVYSGLDNKARRKLTPTKMLPLKNDIKTDTLTQDELTSIIERSNKRRGIW
jgi:hypothetical protein